MPTGRGHTLMSLPQMSARCTIVDDEHSVIATVNHCVIVLVKELQNNSKYYHFLLSDHS